MSYSTPKLASHSKRARHLISPDSPPLPNKRHQTAVSLLGNEMDMEVGKMSVKHLMDLMMEGFSSLLEEKLKHLATTVKKEFGNLKEENIKLNAKIDELTRQSNSCREELEDAQRYIYRNKHGVGKKKVYGFFVDFKTAFDCIDRSALFYKLLNMGISIKFVNVLRNLYTNTKATIWDGQELSKYFPTNTGVRQGDLPSPLLFTLFINDLEEELEEGIKVSNKTISLLMYADDIVLLADDVKKLQRMILQEMICDRWNLTVNLSKSKIMVFRKGGKLARHERWYYKGEAIEVVNTYKYLGIILTPSLSVQQHLKGRLNLAKNSLNTTWSSFISKPNIAISDKINMFQAVARSIMTYGAQVWGYQEFEYVEKLLTFYIKKLLRLPSNTPNYMVYLETGFNKIFLHTLKLHLNYIIRVLDQDDKRITKVLAKECIRLNIFWVPDFIKNAEMTKIDFEVNCFNKTTWIKVKNEILKQLGERLWNGFLEKAQSSTLHDMYDKLLHDTFPRYFANKYSVDAMRVIFQTRGGLLDLNARAFKTNTCGLCSLCNMEEAENTFHFVAICPLLKEFRIGYFGKSELSDFEFKEYLNGKNWDTLYKYVKTALKYRLCLVKEYNC